MARLRVGRQLWPIRRFSTVNPLRSPLVLWVAWALLRVLRPQWSTWLRSTCSRFRSPRSSRSAPSASELSCSAAARPKPRASSTSQAARKGGFFVFGPRVSKPIRLARDAATALLTTFPHSDIKSTFHQRQDICKHHFALFHGPSDRTGKPADPCCARPTEPRQQRVIKVQLSTFSFV